MLEGQVSLQLKRKQRQDTKKEKYERKKEIEKSSAVDVMSLMLLNESNR